MPYVITLDEMEMRSDESGVIVHIMEGYKHGFDNTTITRTDTPPGDGPLLHTHVAEEVHVLPACQMAYTIGDDQFEVAGPCIVRIPAHVPHTFTNIGNAPFNLICFWPHPNFWHNYEEVGPKPLIR
jgi:mannose-6-phosphate isomerase-like protein (cupin superfamily)